MLSCRILTTKKAAQKAYCQVVAPQLPTLMMKQNHRLAWVGVALLWAAIAYTQPPLDDVQPRGATTALTTQKQLNLNRLLLAGLHTLDTTQAAPFSGANEDSLFFRFPIQNRDYQLEVTLNINQTTDRIAIYSAQRLYPERPQMGWLPQRIEYQFNLYADGIYNIRYPKYGILLGISGVRKIEPQPPLDQRVLTIKRRGDDIRFYVNQQLVANMVTNYLTINEIGIDLIGDGVIVRSFELSYLDAPQE